MGRLHRRLMNFLSTKLQKSFIEDFFYNKRKPLIVWVKVPDCSDTINLKTWISKQERVKADRFYFRQDHDSYVVAHSLKRLLLSLITGIDPLLLSFNTDNYGKPELVTNKDITFNLSHTNGLVAIAVAYQTMVGVDVELVDSKIAEYDQLAYSFFAEQEITLIDALPCKHKRQCFFHLWTLKEAFVKAKGKGLSMSLDEFYFTDLKNVNFIYDKNNSKLLGWISYSFMPTEIHHLSVVFKYQRKKISPLFYEISLKNLVNYSESLWCK